MAVNLRRWGVFNLVGFGGFLLQIGAIALLTRGLGWSTALATVAALEVAALHNFFGHSHFTWGDSRASTLKQWMKRFGRYQVAKTLSLGANLAITLALVRAGVPVEIANTLAVLACSLPNYLLAERLVFHHTL